MSFHPGSSAMLLIHLIEPYTLPYRFHYLHSRDTDETPTRLESSYTTKTLRLFRHTRYGTAISLRFEDSHERTVGSTDRAARNVLRALEAAYLVPARSGNAIDSAIVANDTCNKSRSDRDRELAKLCMDKPHIPILAEPPIPKLTLILIM